MLRQVATLFADGISEVGVVHMFWALLCQYAFGYGEYVRSSRICLCAGRGCLGTCVRGTWQQRVFEWDLFAAKKLRQSFYPDSQAVESAVQCVTFSFHSAVLCLQYAELGSSIGLKLRVEHPLSCLFFTVRQR